MQVLPEGSAIPPLPFLLVLLFTLTAVFVALRRISPPVTDEVVVAFAPWMVCGSSLYVLYQVGALPRIIAPLFGSPAVYGSVAAVAGGLWAGTAYADLPADRFGLPSVPGIVALAGGFAALIAVGWVLAVGARRGLTVFWPAVGLVVAVVLATIVWVGLRWVSPGVRVTGTTGVLCVFGHALDGVSTAVGLDVLGFGERSPISRAVIELAAGLPTAAIVGSGWLFVLLKLALAVGVLVLMAGYVREEPTEGYLLLGAVAAVGLGPGAHNLLLFSIVAP